MEIKHIRELIKLMKENDITEIRINEGETKLYLRRGSAELPVIGTASYVQQAAPLSPAAEVQAGRMLPSEPAKGPEPAKGSEDEGKEGEYVTINAPLVGTFYAAPAPDAPPYVKVGDKVNPDTVVCIIEAMKVMNEIKAELSGTIVDVLVKNGEPVEFGQPLFKVKVE